MSIGPIDVTCPYCHMVPGISCVAPRTAIPNDTHPARIRLAAEADATRQAHQLSRDEEAELTRLRDYREKVKQLLTSERGAMGFRNAVETLERSVVVFYGKRRL